jgi:hypothetical protein
MRAPVLPMLLSVAITVAPFTAFAQPARSAPPLVPLATAVRPEPVPSVTEWWRDGGPRVRPWDDRMSQLLGLGLERSAILRRLVLQIEAGNVFVYLQLDPRIDKRLAGKLTFVGNTEKFRYVRVVINPELPAAVIIATIGHELQHVVEVVENPLVRDNRSLVSLYMRIGKANRVTGQPGWETDEAQRIGTNVRREFTSAASAVVSRR